MARTTKLAIQMATGQLVLVMLVGLSLTGCGDQPSAKKLMSQPKTAASTVQEESDPNAKEGPKQAEQSANKATGSNEATSSEQRTSQLDAAVKKLNEQEPIEAHQSKARLQEEVPDREVHEALLPMVEKHWIRLHPGYEVWLDTKGKQVFVGGRISIHDGMLEMFACPLQTKDHESIIATISNAKIIHAGLLASGAIAGRPTRWMPDFIPAFGPKCEMHVMWKSDGENHIERAQDLVLDLDSGKPLESDWVFCGSKVWINPNNPADQDYFADHGELISVSNFPTSMIDLNIESSNVNTGLRFQANAEKIPPPGTPVLIRIKPDVSTNPTEKQLEKADIEIAKAEKQLKEEYEQARKERKARMKKQREEEAKRKAEFQAEIDKRKGK